MAKRSATIVAVLVLMVSTVGAASAAAPTGLAAGSFTYHPFGGPAVRMGSIAGIATNPARGTWQWQNRKGPIACLVIDGSDAWLAGPGTTGPDTGVFIHVHDGGNPGGGDDMAIAWCQDPGQPLDELLGWCETKSEDVPLFPMDRGDVTVKLLQ